MQKPTFQKLNDGLVLTFENVDQAQKFKTQLATNGADLNLTAPEDVEIVGHHVVVLYDIVDQLDLGEIEAAKTWPALAAAKVLASIEEELTEFIAGIPPQEGA